MRACPLRFFCALEAASLALVLCASYVAIDEKDCSDGTCKECTDNGVFLTNQCLATTEHGLYLIANCSTDGKNMTEYTFSDAKCTVQTGTYPTPTGCKKKRTEGYVLDTCETTTTHARARARADARMRTRTSQVKPRPIGTSLRSPAKTARPIGT